MQRSYDVARAILEDTQARPYVAAIGYHTYPYGSDYASIPKILAASGRGMPPSGPLAERARLRDLAKQYGVKLWMTEVSHGEVDPRSFDALRGRAIHIHDELVYANTSAYFGMLNIWEKQAQSEHNASVSFWSGDNEGDFVHVDKDMNPPVTLLGMGYAVGHYARWIDKGALRVTASTDNPLVLVTAFKSGGDLTLVLINNDASAQNTTISVSGLTLEAPLRGEQSSEGKLWSALAALAPEGGATLRLSLPARSVTTLSERGAQPGSPGVDAGGAGNPTDAGTAGRDAGSGAGRDAGGAGSPGGSGDRDGGGSAGRDAALEEDEQGATTRGDAGEGKEAARKSGGCAMAPRASGQTALLSTFLLCLAAWLLRRRSND